MLAPYTQRSYLLVPLTYDDSASNNDCDENRATDRSRNRNWNNVALRSVGRRDVGSACRKDGLNTLLGIGIPLSLVY